MFGFRNAGRRIPSAHEIEATTSLLVADGSFGGARFIRWLMVVWFQRQRLRPEGSVALSSRLGDPTALCASAFTVSLPQASSHFSRTADQRYASECTCAWRAISPRSLARAADEVDWCSFFVTPAANVLLAHVGALH